MRRRPLGLAVVVVSTAVALAGCSLAATESAPSRTPDADVTITVPPPEPGVHLSLIQQRHEEGTRRVGLRVENNTQETLHLRRVGISWPGYGDVRGKTAVVVGAGATIDVPFDLPRERCGVDASARPVGVAVTRRETIRDEVDDMGVRFAERLWRSGCMTRTLRKAAAFSYGSPWRKVERDGQAQWETSVSVHRRRGRQPITLVEAQGSVLFDLAPSGDGRLAGGQRLGELPLLITPGRCDEHARSQASQPFTFRVFFQLGDDPTVLPLVLLPTPPQRRQLLRFLDDACGNTTSH